MCTTGMSLQLCDIIDLKDNVRILWESAQGLAYLHEDIGSRRSVTHCDVKRLARLTDGRIQQS